MSKVASYGLIILTILPTLYEINFFFSCIIIKWSITSCSWVPFPCIFFLFSRSWLVLIVTPNSMWQVFPDLPLWLSAPTPWLCKRPCTSCAWLFCFVPRDTYSMNGIAPCFFSRNLPPLWPTYLLLWVVHLSHALRVLPMSGSPYSHSAGSSIAWLTFLTPLHDCLCNLHLHALHHLCDCRLWAWTHLCIYTSAISITRGLYPSVVLFTPTWLHSYSTWSTFTRLCKSLSTTWWCV